MDIDIDRFKNLKDLLTSQSDLVPDLRKEWSEKILEKNSDNWFKRYKVLVIGAGGLGCELLKNLAVVGIKNISVVDMDTIELTNLNRQFLFRKSDVGGYKAEVAAKFVMKRVPSCKIEYFNEPIQNFSDKWLSKHQIWISGLDSVTVRSYLNAKLFSILKYDESWKLDPYSKRIMIDGGTSGMNGQAQVIIPYDTQCYDCVEKPAQRTHLELCTLANNPRIPEHCIQYVMLVEWENEFKPRKYDTDSPEDMTWIFKKAEERAEQFKIEGVTFQLTLGVVKNIIPIVASTNAIIAAVEVNECIKVLTYCAKLMDGTMGNKQQHGIFNETNFTKRNKNCEVCNKKIEIFEVNEDITAAQMVDQICNLFKIENNDKLLVRTEDGNIKQGGAFRDETDEILATKISDLLSQGTIKRGKEIEVLAVDNDDEKKTYHLRPIYKSS